MYELKQQRADASGSKVEEEEEKEKEKQNFQPSSAPLCVVEEAN
jgi:hypothetical protein